MNRRKTLEVALAARLLSGKSVVLIGGSRRPRAQGALKGALGLRNLIWIGTREHESIDRFEHVVARPEVALVLLAIRWSSHSFEGVKKFCGQYAKPLVRLPGGYGVNQVAAQILSQCSEQLDRARGKPMDGCYTRLRSRGKLNEDLCSRGPASSGLDFTRPTRKEGVSWRGPFTPTMKEGEMGLRILEVTDPVGRSNRMAFQPTDSLERTIRSAQALLRWRGYSEQEIREALLSVSIDGTPPPGDQSVKVRLDSITEDDRISVDEATPRKIGEGFLGEWLREFERFFGGPPEG